MINKNWIKNKGEEENIKKSSSEIESDESNTNDEELLNCIMVNSNEFTNCYKKLEFSSVFISKYMFYNFKTYL